MPPSAPLAPKRCPTRGLPSISRYSRPCALTFQRIPRSLYFLSTYCSHRSGGSRICPSASTTLVYAILLSPLQQLWRTTHRVWTRSRIHQHLALPGTSYSWLSKVSTLPHTL